MKTITEYGPMIFTQVANHAAERVERRRYLLVNACVILGYSAFGIWLTLDTGFAPWDWQFWLVFLPLFIAGEMIERTLRTK